MIEIKDVSFSYKKAVILDRFSCSITGAWPVAIMGSSGCGKSTLLRLIVGLERSQVGKIKVTSDKENGQNLARIFYTFQDFDAFPWLTVQENVDFVLRHSKRSISYSDKILKDVGLNEHSGKYLRELSGGMRKRLALARASASCAEVLLLDEPFSSLDVRARGEMYRLLMTICSRGDVLPLIVTDTVEEAVFLAARVIICDGPPLHVVRDISVEVPFPRMERSREDSRFETAYLEVQRALSNLRGTMS